jgi:hypothetical protein
MRHTGVLLFILFIAGSHSILFAAKIDTVFLQQGDRITGEVKSLENNYLRLSTYDVGTVKVEWNKIDSVKILTSMRIELVDGRIIYGKLLTSGIVGSCYIWRREGDPLLVKLIRIVALTPVEEKFIDRLNGTLSTGFSYVKASDIAQLNFSGSLEYLARKNHGELFYESIITQDSLKTTQRHNGGATFIRILPKKWFLISSFSLESNSELELDLRSNWGVGGGRSLIRTNFTNFYLAGGVQFNREQSKGVEHFNIEGVLETNYSVFIYDDPEVSLDIKIDLIPSLNDFGRLRSNINSNLRWEVLTDFFLKWTFYYTHDNKPLSETAAKTDWAVTLLGVEYKL